MFFQFLVEDASGKVLIEKVMEKILVNNPNVYYSCNSFGGLGGFKKDGSLKEAKNGKLLNELPALLRAFDRSLRTMDGGAAAIIVVDNDDRDTATFQTQLEDIARENRIVLDHVFCIAVEEIEAWLLGDVSAVERAYPHAKLQKLQAYRQDSICGTWEVLADVVYPGGCAKLKKANADYAAVGKWKRECAARIGAYLDLSCNKSPSFQLFLHALESRLSCAS